MDCISRMNSHCWRNSPGTSGIGRPSHSWAFQRSETTKMNIELSFFHYHTDYTNTCSLTTIQFSTRNYPVWILAEFPQVQVRTPPFNLLNSWESIQGSSRTTCQLQNNPERPAAKCSSGHSLRTCWCEILPGIPFDPTDLSPDFMKNWSNLLWLRVCGVVGLAQGRYYESLSFICQKTISQVPDACVCMFLPILAWPHCSFKLLVLGVADPFL